MSTKVEEKEYDFIEVVRLDRFLKKIRSMKEFKRVEFVILYGSVARGREMKSSDIDICIYYEAEKEEEMSKFRLKLLSELCRDEYDVQIFQQLPLYMRKEVLKGKVLYVREKKFLYKIALETIKDFESFKPHFYDYIYR
jgi:predicted nucleotidyltransferase